MSITESQLGPLADELNHVLDHANDVIRACGFGVFAKVQIDTRTWLAFGKLKNVWCLHILYESNSETHPEDLLNNTIARRIHAAQHLPQLVHELRCTQAAFLNTLQHTIEATRKFVSELEQLL